MLDPGDIDREAAVRQHKPPLRLDLTEGRNPDPSPDGKVVRLSRKQRPPDHELDLAGNETPTASGEIHVVKEPDTDESTVSLEFRILKWAVISVRHSGRGPVGGVAPAYSVALLVAPFAGALAPRLILSPDASQGARIGIAVLFLTVMLGVAFGMHAIRHSRYPGADRRVTDGRSMS